MLKANKQNKQKKPAALALALYRESSKIIALGIHSYLEISCIYWRQYSQTSFVWVFLTRLHRTGVYLQPGGIIPSAQTLSPCPPTGLTLIFSHSLLEFPCLCYPNLLHPYYKSTQKAIQASNKWKNSSFTDCWIWVPTSLTKRCIPSLVNLLNQIATDSHLPIQATVIDNTTDFIIVFKFSLSLTVITIAGPILWFKVNLAGLHLYERLLLRASPKKKKPFHCSWTWWHIPLSPSTGEAKAGGSLWIWDSPALCSKFQAN